MGYPARITGSQYLVTEWTKPMRVAKERSLGYESGARRIIVHKCSISSLTWIYRSHPVSCFSG